jgi:hypothetical protein
MLGGRLAERQNDGGRDFGVSWLASALLALVTYLPFVAEIFSVDASTQTAAPNNEPSNPPFSAPPRTDAERERLVKAASACVAWEGSASRLNHDENSPEAQRCGAESKMISDAPSTHRTAHNLKMRGTSST